MRTLRFLTLKEFPLCHLLANNNKQENQSNKN